MSLKYTNIILFTFVCYLTPCLRASAEEQACMCPPQLKSVKDTYQQSGVVVVGTVEKFGKSALRPGMNEASIKIMSRYKGLEDVKSSLLYVYTPISKQKCGMSLIVSQDYLLYADGNAARPVVSSCSRSDVLDNALGQLEELRQLSVKQAK